MWEALRFLAVAAPCPMASPSGRFVTRRPFLGKDSPILFYISFLFLLNKAAAAQKRLSTPVACTSLVGRRVLLVYCGILTQLSKQEEGQSRHRWRLPAVNTRSATGCVCSPLGSTGARYISVGTNKGREHSYIFKVFCSARNGVPRRETKARWT